MKHSKSGSILKTTTDRRLYLRVLTWQDPWDDRDRFLVNRVKRGRVGYWKKKGIYPYQSRSYRTWKHNRQTQWKQ